MSEHREAVEEYAARVGLRVEWEGEVGFGRECVGLVDPDANQYVGYVRGYPPDRRRARLVPQGRVHRRARPGPDRRGGARRLGQAAREAGATYERLPKVIPDVMTLLTGQSTDFVALPADLTLREAAAIAWRTAHDSAKAAFDQ